jgi:hypothetical protein
MVRPDGYVAWRQPASVSDPIAELTRALERILRRADRAAT